MAGVTVAIALGSNLGDREAHLAFAWSRLELLLRPYRASRVFETAPVGVIGRQTPFLNAAVVGHTTLSARDLLAALLGIEAARGRVRPHPHAPRTLDLDLILYGQSVIDEAGLVVPHPRFRERRFVLDPLVEIAPDLVDPVTGRTLRTLRADIREP